ESRLIIVSFASIAVKPVPAINQNHFHREGREGRKESRLVLLSFASSAVKPFPALSQNIFTAKGAKGRKESRLILLSLASFAVKPFPGLNAERFLCVNRLALHRAEGIQQAFGNGGMGVDGEHHIFHRGFEFQSGH